MVFSSLEFLFFYLPAVLLIYFLIPARYLAARNLVLLLVSLLFYGWSEPIYICIMLLSIIVDYTCGRIVSKNRQSSPKKAKAALIASVVINLSILCFFKYTDFIILNLSRIPIFSNLKPLGISLPVGISFYTFQTMSYTLDVYLGAAQMQRNLATFGSYVTMFPQLIAGPIVRYRDVDDELRVRVHTLAGAAHGAQRFICGLAKKVLLANTAGVFYTSFVEGVYDTPSILGAWFGIIFFAFQIYFDFSGYSDMARGLGNMFGFEFMKNFDYPYISKSITEFWRRWHISLGTWFKEYVYIPLGGNRCKWYRHLFNIFVVWFLTGLWHGASWNFVIWGVYFGVLLVIEKYFLLKLFKKLPQFISHIYTMFFVIIGWAIFDFTNFAEMISFIGRLFTLQNGFVSENGLYLAVSYLPILVVGTLACLPIWKKLYYKVSEKKFTWILEGAVCAVVLILCVASLVKQSYNPFLYFRF